MLDAIAVDLENPKAHWNYGNEDFLGRICKVACRNLRRISLYTPSPLPCSSISSYKTQKHTKKKTAPVKCRHRPKDRMQLQ